MWAKRNRGRSGRSGSSPPINPSVLDSSSTPKNISKDLPALPSEALETSPLQHNDYQDRSRYADDDPGISPPDSPIDMTGQRSYSIHDVSPIDETAGHFFPEPSVKKPSQIPVPRRYSQSNVLNKSGTGRESPADANPTVQKATTPQMSSSRTAMAKTTRTPKAKHHHHASSLLQSGREKLQIFSKVRDQKQRPREQWKGASGRAPLVGPIESNPAARTTPPRSHSPHVGTEFADYGSNTYTVTTITAGNSSDEKPRKKSRQPKAKEDSWDLASESNVSLPLAGGSSDEAKDGGDQTPPAVDKLTPLTSTDLEQPNDFSSTFQKLNLIDEPQSRFSASTYNATELATTPPGSAGSDSPAEANNPPSPIMTRRRPIPGYASSIKSTKRKPVGSETPPPEVDLASMTPQDRLQHRINSLQFRTNELFKRKTSVKTMLYELTQVIQPSSVAYDMAAREEVKKTVASLNNELADITKEEHDLGVKLSRAYRKLDTADNYEHSSLWVKSIDR